MSDKLLIDKLFLLESKLRQNHVYEILEPFSFNANDHSEVQVAAKKIAHHLGMKNMTFIISYAIQKENTAGHIHLDHGNDVFIEISVELKNDHEAVLSVLAHEICHKYLHKYNLKLFPEFENEILTDTATIFTGLGKLTLNGCEKHHFSQSDNFDGSKTKTQKSQKLGYLNKSQFAFLYKICSTIHGIDDDDMFRNLTTHSKNHLHEIEERTSNFLNKNYFKKDFVLTKLKEDLKDSQTNFAIFQRNILTIEKIILPYCGEMTKEFNKLLFSNFNDIKKKFQNLENSSSNAYLSNLATIDEYETFKKDVYEFELKMQKIIRTFDKFNEFIANHTTEEIRETLKDTTYLNEFKCPCCNQKMKISDKKLARVSCTKCNHSFIIDTGHEKETRRESRTVNSKNKGGLSTWFSSKFKT